MAFNDMNFRARLLDEKTKVLNWCLRRPFAKSHSLLHQSHFLIINVPAKLLIINLNILQSWLLTCLFYKNKKL